MDDRIKNIWVDRLALSSLPGVRAAIKDSSRPVVHCVRKSAVAAALLRIMRPRAEIRDLAYQLGDLKAGKESMGMRFQLELPSLANKVVGRLRNSALYRELLKQLPGEKVDLYFEKKVSAQLPPMLYLYMVVLWSEHRDPGAENVIVCSNVALSDTVSDILARLSIRFVFYNKFWTRAGLAQNFIELVCRYFFYMRYFLVSQGPASGPGPLIAVHCSEGVRNNSRSDLYWWEKSGVSADRVVFFFDKDFSSRKSLETAYEKANSLGMGWIACRDGRIRKMRIFKSAAARAVTLPLGPGPGAIFKAHPDSDLERWIYLTAKRLLIEVGRWRAFFDHFNIRIMLKIGGPTAEAIAQNIAMDSIGGLRAGIQRSTVSLFEWLPFLRYDSNDILFVWGREAGMHRGTSPAIRRLVITGYPFDKAFNLPAGPRGRRFKIALFDNGFDRDIYFSRAIVSRFYRIFLEWADEDDGLVLIAKEKKSRYIDQFEDIKALAISVEKSGRLVRFSDPLESFPSEASAQADISVGIGVSSALIEAVITGNKGVHCDMAEHKAHPYYSWGRDKIIFEDPARLIEALKDYKDGGVAYSGLGDWSAYIDTLEPFRDGRGGERIGRYIKDLLDGFDAGLDKDGSIERASKSYAELWGPDKVLPASRVYNNEVADACV